MQITEHSKYNLNFYFGGIKLRKILKSVLALLLSLLTIISLAPIFNFFNKADAASNNIKDTLDAIIKVYPSDSYFTNNGKSCSGHNAFGTCYNCSVRGVIESSKCKELLEKLNGTKDTFSSGNTCYALASFCFTECFGKLYDSSNFKSKSSDSFDDIKKHKFQDASSSTKKKFFQQAKCGDIITIQNWSGGNYSTVHYMVFYSCSDSGIKVYENNVRKSQTDTKVGVVKFHSYSFSGMNGNSFDGWDKIVIQHAKNYDEVSNTVSKPTASTSNYEGGVKVTLSTVTSGATIYYTTDGSTPSSSSTKYTEPFKLSSTKTIKAYAVKSGMTSSDKLSKKITVSKTDIPIFNELTATSSGYNLTIKNVKDTVFYYTLDGSEPVTSGKATGTKYSGAIEIKENTTVKVVAVKKGQTFSDVVTKEVKVSAPSTPSLALISDSVVGIGDTINLNWTESQFALGYKLVINGVEQEDLVAGCATAIPVETAGEYNIQVKAVNTLGESDLSTPPVKVTVKPDVTVTFKDGDTVIDKQIIHYGKDAIAPSPTSKKGYTFSRWNGKYTSVKLDTEVIAEYSPITYTIKFVDEYSNIIGEPQSVDYGKSAKIPDAPVKSGYKFVSWSAKSGSEGTNYTEVDGNATFEPVYVWANPDLPIGVTISEAKKTSNSYAVKTNITNHSGKQIYGKLIAVIKAANDKVVAQSISQVQIPADANEKEYSVNINSKSNAMLCEVYIVGNEDEICNDRTGGALSEKASCAVSIDTTGTVSYWGEWGDWTTTPITASDSVEVETKTQYRFSDREEKTSYESAIDGYTKLNDVSWIDQGDTTVYYVKSWPTGSSPTKGFCTENELYNKYNNKSKIKSSANNTDTYKYEKISETVNGYLYWHWCYKHDMGKPDDCQFSDHKGKQIGNYKTNYFHAFKSSKKLTYVSTANAFKKSDSNNCPYTYWWSSAEWGEKGDLIVYKYVYKTYRAQYTFERWSDWSDWSDTIVTPIENSRKVETRILYRCRNKEIATDISSNIFKCEEDLSGTKYTISGNLQNISADYSGKQATVLVYKGKNSDATESQLEYVGQLMLGANNSYNFSFVPKEEISTSTGDYIVSFSVATATRLINNAYVIEAPKPIYKVEFKDYNGNLIESQNVESGSSATAPEFPMVEGYTSKWNKTFTNITANTIVTQQLEAKSYSVIFVDFENDKIVSIQDVTYGEKAKFPANPSAEGMNFVEWNFDKDSTITGTTIIEAVYEPIIKTVNFLNKDGSVFITEEVEYGSSANIPEGTPVADGYEFIAWDSSTAWWDVKSDVSVKPIFIYEKTVETPVFTDEFINLGEGLLDIESSTEDAEIRYTTDGSEPTEEDLLFDDTVYFDETTTVRARAFKVGMNASDIAEFVVDVVPEDDIPVVSAVTNITQYEIGEDYANICMKIENPQKFKVLSYGYLITDESTGETSEYENTNSFVPNENSFGKVFKVGSLNSGTDYSYSFFANFEINGEECYFDTAPKNIGESENSFTTSGSKINENAILKVAPSQTVDYRSIVTITATATDVAENCKLELYVNGIKVATGDNKSVSYSAGELKTDLTYSVVVVDNEGNIATDGEGNELRKDGGKITVNAGFFKKLVAFFKGLFKKLPTVAIKP